jgi:glycosyltransferase involved in cell wall biosynthesis
MIVTIISEYANTNSGAGNVIQNIAAELIKQSMPVYLVTNDQLPYNPSGVKVYQFPYVRFEKIKNPLLKVKVLLSYFVYIFKIMINEGSDIILTHGIYVLYLAKIVGVIFKIPVLATLHSYAYSCDLGNRIYKNRFCDNIDEWKCSRCSGALVNVRRMVSRRIFATLASGIITLNNLEYSFFRKIVPNKTYLLSNGIDLNIFYPRVVEKLPNSIIFVGGFRTVKRLDILIDAFVKVLRTIPDLRLSVVGDLNPVADSYLKVNLTDYVSRIKKKIEKNNIADKIDFIGEVPKAKMPELYSKHSIFVSCSFTEVNPLAFLESLACGVPVIGFINPLNMDIVVSNPERLHEDIINNINIPLDQKIYDKIRKRYSMSTILKQYIHLFRSIIYRNSPGNFEDR